jgi:hypothetical protein
LSRIDVLSSVSALVAASPGAPPAAAGEPAPALSLRNRRWAGRTNSNHASSTPTTNAIKYQIQV